jgi:hypothetical protein
MSETPEEFRQRAERVDEKYHEDVAKRGGQFRDLSFEYEKLAVDYSNKGIQTLTYLNGGALIAIPTAMAFFKADVAKVEIIWTAAVFIAGLLFVVLAQAGAFFTMAIRSEANEQFMWEQFNRVTALLFQHTTTEQQQNMQSASDRRDDATRKRSRSNKWRRFGIFCFALSLIAFILGCVWGARAVVIAKENSARPLFGDHVTH